MKLNMLAKYIFLYLLVAVLGFAGVTLIMYRIDYSKVYNSYTDSCYRQAIAIADAYADTEFSADNLNTINKSLTASSAQNDARIIFIEPSGNVVLDTGFKGTAADSTVLYTISDFDYSNLGREHTWLGVFYGVFESRTLSVFAPITSSFTTRGYVVVSVPESVILKNTQMVLHTNYLTLAMFMLLALGFILFYVLYIHKPLEDMSKAIVEYGKGNMEYTLNPKHNDEIGRLENSLNYMAKEINEMDIFQQKFLSNISHDFRSPLTSIKGYLEAISDGTIPPEQTKKYIDIVLFETDRLTNLTSNILTLNEVDPKTVHLDLTIFDINSIIRHTIETMEGNCKKKNIHFKLTFAAEEESVRADKQRIQQVIYNLIDNAIKFSSENSTIFVTVKERGDKAYISVKDTGVGISRENLDKIWDRFFKSDSSRGRDKKGSGLGLSITKEIIQAHNETIDVVSTPGVGTEFIFTLPLMQKENS